MHVGVLQPARQGPSPPPGGVGRVSRELTTLSHPVAGYLAGLRWAARPPMGRTGEGGHTGSGQGCRQAPGSLG